MVRHFRKLAATLAAIALGGGTGGAQSPPPAGANDYPRYEIAILGGYRFESTLTFQNDRAPFDRVEIGDAPTWGITLGWSYGPNSELEVQYSYASPQARAIERDSGGSSRAFGIGVNDIQLAWLGNFYRWQAIVRPFFGLGLGATILDTDQNLGGDRRRSPSASRPA